MELVLSAVVGVAIGIIVGMLGAGGGILSVPALVYLLGQEPHDAAAGSLVIVLLSAFSSLLAHSRHNHVNWRGGFAFAAVSAITAFGGAQLAPLVSGALLMVLFSMLLLSVSAVMMVRGVRSRRQEQRQIDGDEAVIATERVDRPQVWKIIAAGSVVGLMSGVFGVGGGFAVVPLLVFVFGFPMVEAAGTSVLVMMISAVFGLVGRIGTPVEIDWPIVLVFAAGSAVGGLLGEPISRRARPSTLTITFGVLLLVIAVLTALQNI